MEIRFKVKAKDLNEALAVVSIVPPQAVTPDGGSGFLFVVNGQTCKVYSSNRVHVARASFPIEPVEGEGAFMYPSQFIGTFKYMDGEILFTATEQEGAFKIRYVSEGGKEDRVTFDPRSMGSCERDIEAAEKAGVEKTFNIALLKEAISAGKSFMADSNHATAEDHYKSLQVFGAPDPSLADTLNPKVFKALENANGTLFSSNTVEAFYFYCKEFENNDLVVPGTHLSGLEAFLAKSSGEMKIYPTAAKTFVKNTHGHVFGWTRHAAEYKAFAYYNKSEGYVFDLDCKDALLRLQYLRAALDKKKDKIRFHYEAASEQVFFSVVDENSETVSAPMKIAKVQATTGRDLVTHVNVDHMMDLFRGAKGGTIEFRIMHLPADHKRIKDQFMFRTIDEYLLDQEGRVVGGSGVANVPDGAHLCRVTRYVPGKD